jgi:hypothetical protein
MRYLRKIRVRLTTAFTLCAALAVLALPGDAAAPDFVTDDNTNTITRGGQIAGSEQFRGPARR